jgi:RNA polymerase sigma-70 factor (ECF subfamily)
VTELSAAFEEHRGHLRGVALRLLGSAAEADDAVQNAWLKVTRAETGAVENLRAWLTTIVSRVCLDMLRSRSSRREESLDAAPERAVAPSAVADRELAETVGMAAMIVLDQLAPPERIAFVLHDMFGMSFEEIAPIVSRTPPAARQLASRARRRVQSSASPEIELPVQRRVVDSFIAALRAGDVQALVSVLGGNEEWAKGAIAFRRSTEHMRSILVDGRVGLALAPGGKIQRVLIFTLAGETIKDAEIITEPDAIAELVIQELS